MRDRVRSALMQLGLWCFECAGLQLDYLDALHDAQNARVMAELHDRDRADALRRLGKLLASAQLADGLLSTSQPDKAQQQLRVGIIAAGGIASSQKKRQSATPSERSG